MKPAPFVIAFLVLLATLVAIQLSCASARQRGAAGVGAFLSCTAADFPPSTLADATGLATSALMRWISGSGKVDTAGVKADMAPLKSDLLRCAWAGAVAALTAPRQPAAPGAPANSPLEVDAATLRMTFEGVAARLGWPAMRTMAVQ